MTKLYKISYSECDLWLLIHNVKIPIDFSNSVDKVTFLRVPAFLNTLFDHLQMNELTTKNAELFFKMFWNLIKVYIFYAMKD